MNILRRVIYFSHWIPCSYRNLITVDHLHFGSYQVRTYSLPMEDRLLNTFTEKVSKRDIWKKHDKYKMKKIFKMISSKNRDC